MAFKNILFAYSGEAAYSSSLGHAIKLVQHYDGWLTGVFRNGQSYLEKYGGGLSSDLREKILELQVNDIHKVIADFDQAVVNEGIQDRAEFIEPKHIGSMLPSQLARHYDLVVTGVHSDLANEEHISASPDMIALHSGRPVIVVPKEYFSTSLADHALVAWDGKRSAARALGDAMNILEGKKRVTILTVGSKEPEKMPDGGVLRHLERHGIIAKHIHRMNYDKSIAAIIEDTAEEVQAKLIIMGAYEHSKFSQDFLGGVTHEVLKTTRVPLFLSH